MPYMGQIKQSTGVTKTILMVDSSDHITGKTGLTITKYVTKAGGTPAATTITTSELDSTNVKGIYSLAFSSSDVDTLGDFQVHLTASGADPADYWWTVTARLPDDLAYPATSGRSMVVDANGLVDANAVKVGPSGSGTAQTARDIGASVLLSSGTGAGQISLSSGAVTVGTNNDKTGYTASTVSDKTGYALSSAGVQAIWDALTSALTTVGSIGKLIVDNINATISSRLASASYTAPDNTGIATIQAQTDKLTFDSDNYLESHPMTGVTVTTNNDKTGYTASTVSDKTGYSLTSAYDPAKTAAQDSDLQTALTDIAAIPTANENAAALLKYDWSGITGEASRSVLNALRAIRNKFSTTASAGYVTIYKEDDTTAAYTKALTTDSDAAPIVEG